MNEIEIFYQDKDECRIPFSHISEAVTDPSLKALDEYYGAADVLSVYNARSPSPFCCMTKPNSTGSFLPAAR